MCDQMFPQSRTNWPEDGAFGGPSLLCSAGTLAVGQGAKVRVPEGAFAKANTNVVSDDTRT